MSVHKYEFNLLLFTGHSHQASSVNPHGYMTFLLFLNCYKRKKHDNGETCISMTWYRNIRTPATVLFRNIFRIYIMSGRINWCLKDTYVIYKPVFQWAKICSIMKKTHHRKDVTSITLHRNSVFADTNNLWLTVNLSHYSYSTCKFTMLMFTRILPLIFRCMHASNACIASGRAHEVVPSKTCGKSF